MRVIVFVLAQGSLAFFNWAQEHIVGPAVTRAFDEFDWDIVKRLAMRTKLDFTYFGKHFGVRFDNFASTEERIRRGLQVYHRAEHVGLDDVERALGRYKQIPVPQFPQSRFALPPDFTSAR